MTAQLNQHPLIQRALAVIPMVVEKRGLPVCFQTPLIVTRAGRRYLFLPVKLRAAIEAGAKLSDYANADLLHDAQTMLREKFTQARVVASNSNGLRYCVPLDGAPTLPNSVLMPPALPDIFPLGVSLSGHVHLTSDEFGNALVTGAPNSGKSNFELVQAVNALRQGWQLYLADAEGHTFAPEAWNAVARVPVAVTKEEFVALIAELETELDRRRVLFGRAGQNGFLPTNLEEYNGVAAKRGLSPLPQALFIADECNSYLDVRGMDRRLEEVARRGRKWGLLMVLAAHSWRAKDVSRTLSALFKTRVCFRTADETTGAVVMTRHAGKQAMALDAKGRGLVMANGQRPQLFQAYFIAPEAVREFVVGQQRGEAPVALSEVEVLLVQYAMRELGGAFTLSKLAAAFRAEGLTKYQVELIASRLEKRGWLTHPRDAISPRRVTPQLAQWAGVGDNLPTGDGIPATVPMAQVSVMESTNMRR